MKLLTLARQGLQWTRSFLAAPFAACFFGSGKFALSHALCRIAIGISRWHLLSLLSPDWETYLTAQDRGS
jgi:hypothetical protein